MRRTIVVQPGQTMEDIALQEYGHADAVEWLLRDNREALPEGFCTRTEPGMELVLRNEEMDADMLRRIRGLLIVPASAEDMETLVGPGGDHNDDHNTDHSIETE